MPLLRYEPLKAPCKLCSAGFEHRQEAGAPDLATCPTCGQAVSRCGLPLAVHTPKLLKPLSVTDAKRAGFSVWKRTSSGEFERQ
jgi:hypothetical protein